MKIEFISLQLENVPLKMRVTEYVTPSKDTVSGIIIFPVGLL